MVTQSNLWRSEYARNEVGCMTCHQTMTEGKCVYSCSEWPYLKLGGKAFCHRGATCNIDQCDTTLEAFMVLHSVVHAKSDGSSMRGMKRERLRWKITSCLTFTTPNKWSSAAWSGCSYKDFSFWKIENCWMSLAPMSGKVCGFRPCLSSHQAL